MHIVNCKLHSLIVAPSCLPCLAHCQEYNKGAQKYFLVCIKVQLGIFYCFLKFRSELMGERCSCSSFRFAEDSSSSPPPYLNLINNLVKSEKLTDAEMRFKEKIVVETMKLNKQIKQAQMEQEWLKEETRQLHAEKLLVQAENKFFLEYLTNKTEEYRRQPEKLWNNYLQESGETERRRQESASKYAKQTSVLKTELLEKEKIHSNLKQQLQALRDISVLKEKQEREMQTLQAETAAKKQEIHVQFLQQKALLEKQLTEPDMSQLGKRRRKELNRKTQPLELAAKQYNFEFYRDINRKNQQLKKELLQLNQQCQELQATPSQLKNQKQQLQQEQWYVECLMPGRRRLQGRHNGAQKVRVLQRPHRPLP
ncbi:coiled-coil domain-containing protein 121-like [Diceros bicornis minor]|uniref:coiled-coil domain-containing protein 121-like n=1 Tax=Diceros bicornis minor TaxID=77932 RepID=UPI0026F12A29|nr:coiled-coil domain-containing protein 121-like [Diceros bicornis minor]